jgi:hypothetical protein
VAEEVAPRIRRLLQSEASVAAAGAEAPMDRIGVVGWAALLCTESLPRDVRVAEDGALIATLLEPA